MGCAPPPPHQGKDLPPQSWASQPGLQSGCVPFSASRNVKPSARNGSTTPPGVRVAQDRRLSGSVELPGLLSFLQANTFMVSSSLEVSEEGAIFDGRVLQPPPHTSSLGSLSAGGSPSYHHPSLQNWELLPSLWEQKAHSCKSGSPPFPENA